MKKDEHETIRTEEFKSNNEFERGIKLESSESGDESTTDGGKQSEIGINEIGATESEIFAISNQPQGATSGKPEPTERERGFDNKTPFDRTEPDGELAKKALDATIQHSEKEPIEAHSDASQASSEAAQTDAEEVGPKKDAQQDSGIAELQSEINQSSEQSTTNKLVNMSRAEFYRHLHDAYERGRNEAIEARFQTDSHTVLPQSNNEHVPFLTGRKSVWERS